MTDDFKEKLLNYLTANYEVNSGNNVPHIVFPVSNFTTNVYTLLNNMSSDYVIANKTTSPDGNFVVYYGYYATATKGFIAIINEKFEMVKLLTTFSGGGDLPALYFLNYDESGLFYGIGVDSSVKKLYLLNNFCVKLIGDNYSVIFRQSYTLDGDLQDSILSPIMSVVKKGNTGKYLFIIPYVESSGVITRIIVSTLEIVVAGDNVWTHIIYDVSLYTENSCFYGEWIDDNYNYKFCQSASTYIQYRGSNNGSLVYNSLSLPVSGNGQAVALSLADTYCSINASLAETSIFKIYKIEDGTSYRELFSFEQEKPATYVTRISMVKVDNVICFDFSYPYTAPGGTIYFAGEIGRVIDDRAYALAPYDLAGPFEIPSFFLKKQFNEIDYFLTIYGETSVEVYTEIYNSSNYNGYPYQALNSMIPESSILYDENDKIAFARNLYNKTISGGTTTSTVEVPNNYLNDINISKEELISETNSIVNSDTTAITKNIYEQLYINFINTLNVIDNNTATPVLNPTGASRINDSISQTMDYDDAKITKFVINYSDNTSDVRNFCSKTYSSIENRVTYSCIIYVPLDKNISNIQIKSNDENTIYQTIDCSSLESNKYYVITQDVSVI